MTTTTNPAGILAKAGVTNPAAAYVGENRPLISFEKDGLNFHVWLDPETLQIPAPRKNALTDKLEKVPLYCNPPTSILRGEAGHFDTRHLDALAKKWKPIVEAVLASVDLAAALAAYEEKIAAEEAERERQIALRLTAADADTLDEIAGNLDLDHRAALRLIAEKIRNHFKP